MCNTTKPAHTMNITE